MSLKKYIKKSVAAYIAISMLYSNFYLCGLGISDVIAQDIKEPSIEINLENVQYIQFNEEIVIESQEEQEGQGAEVQKEYDTGVAIKSKLQMVLEEQETQLPIKGAEVAVNLPVINGILPERANVVLANTKLTTGEEEKSINQNYDVSSGLLTMSYQNEMAYSNYNKDSKDEFEIIYIYPAEAYTGNEEEITLQYSANSKMIFETENGEITSEKIQGFELKEKDNKGDLLEFNITKLENDVYKGFMYSNVENGTNYETEYNTVSSLCVLNSNNSKELSMEIKENEFVLNDEDSSKIPTSGRTIYKSTEISKEQFDKILGQDGIIEIFNGETLLATVGYIAVSEDDEIVNRLAVIYSDDNVKVLSPEETIAKVEYGENITSLLIKTTKPIAEGYLNFKNQNIIIPARDYIVRVEDIKSINTVSTVNEVARNAEILLSESETKMSVNSSNVNISTLQNNTTTLTINLDSTNITTKLFENPTLEIKLPEGLVGGNVSSPSIINGNGLKLKGEPRLGESSNVIIVELEGKQTEYDLNNVSGGTTIVMDIENLDYEDTIPAHTDWVEVTCIQDREKVSAKQDINIVSKAGLLMLSKVNGHNSTETVTNINGGIQEIQISGDSDKKELHQSLALVNNYGIDLENFEVIGKIGYSDSELTSTMDVALLKEIKVNKENAQVYYSNNKNAKSNDESWTTEFNKESKAFKIVLNETKLLKEESAFIDLYVELPENIGFNHVIALKAEANYTYNNNAITESTITKMITPQVELMSSNRIDIVGRYESLEDLGLEVGVSTLVSGEPITEETEINEGQIVRYNVVLKNNSQEKISDLDLKTEIKNAVYYETDVIGSASGNPITGYVEKEITDVIRNKTIELEANETKLIEYQVVVNDNTNNVENIIKLSKNNNTIYEKNVTNNVKQSNLKLKVESEYNEEYLIYTKNKLGFVINVTNISEDNMKNVKVSCELPSDVSFDIENWRDYYFEEELQDFDNIKMEDNTLYFEINSLEVGQTKRINVRTKAGALDATTPQKDVVIVAKAEHARNTYTSNDLVKTIYQNEFKLSSELISITNTEKPLKDGDEVSCKVVIKNEGSLTINGAVIRMLASNGLKINKYIDSVHNQEVILEEGNTFEVEGINIGGLDSVEYVFYGIIEKDKALTDTVQIEGEVYDGVDGFVFFDDLSYEIDRPEDVEEEEEIEYEEDEEIENTEEDIIEDFTNADMEEDEVDYVEPEQPQPEQPQPEQPQPEQPQPEQPEPEQPQPEQPEPEQPQPEEPHPDNPEPEQPEPEQPEPEQPQPEEPEPEQPQPEEPHPDNPEPEQPEPEEPHPDNPEPEQPQPEQPEPEQPITYTISGVAWQDLDKNGVRSENETLKQGIVVSLINMSTGNYALDSNGNRITATTDKQGRYTFTNLSQGTYTVMFEFNTEEYTVSTYQKEGVSQTENSDAILSTVTVDGQTKKVGITDKIELNSNIENLDIGLIQNAIFDLNLDKKITKITVVDKQGTKEYVYKDGHTAKVDLVAKYMNGANVIVNYNFTITNKGEVAGYVDSLVDSLPSGLEFNSELNKDWYKGSDGKLYTKSLSGIAIKPGESTQIDLVLTKTMTEENAGTFVNNASLEKISNLENIQEKENALEGNESSAILIISIKTGSVMLYIGITMLCLAIIGAGAYFINKKILIRGI